MKNPYSFTKIDGVGYSCNDCGAVGSSVEMVKHYPTCTPGSCQQEIESNNARDLDQEEIDDRAYQEYLNGG